MEKHWLIILEFSQRWVSCTKKSTFLCLMKYGERESEDFNDFFFSAGGRRTADSGRLSLYVYALSSLLCECMCVWLISFFFFFLSIFVLFWWNVLFDVIVRVWVRWWMGNNSLSHWEARVCEYMCNLSFNSGLGFNVCTLY